MIDTNHGAAAGATTANINSALGCADLVPQVGITSTPTIDPSTGTMYVETKSAESGTYVHRLHAIDITTGNEKASSPVVISASVPGTGDGSSGGTLTFDALHHMNRPGVLLVNGIIYLAYASHCDFSPYHGWVFAYDAKTMTQQAVYVTTPNGGLGGFWMAGSGVAADSNANIFVASGNGDFDTTNVPATELGDTILRLSLGASSLSLVDYFTPHDQGSMESGDQDLGSGGVTLLPDQAGAHPHELVEAGKEGTLYLVDRDQMTTGNQHYCNGCSSDTQIVQELVGSTGGMFSMPTYWNNTVYTWGVSQTLRAYSLTSGLLSTSAITKSSSSLSYPGSATSASANGANNGIIWTIDATGYKTSAAAVLHAFNATNLATELYNSTQAAGNRDQAGGGVKYATPTIANGKVYVGTETELDVYGLLP